MPLLPPPAFPPPSLANWPLTFRLTTHTHPQLTTTPPPLTHHESIFILFLKSGVSLEANVIAHEFTRPLCDPQPLLLANTAPVYMLQILIHTTPCHEDSRSWFFPSTKGFLTIAPKTSLPTPTTDKPTARLIADAHCILPINSSASPYHKLTSQKFAIHILPSARVSLLMPHDFLPIFTRHHTSIPVLQQLPLVLADIHPGLGASSHFIQ